jgi:hypothetical protein
MTGYVQYISNLDIGPPTPSPVGRVGRQLRQPKEVSSLLLDFLVHSYSRVRFLFRSGPGRCFDLLSRGACPAPPTTIKIDDEAASTFLRRELDCCVR